MSIHTYKLTVLLTLCCWHLYIEIVRIKRILRPMGNKTMKYSFFWWVILPTSGKWRNFLLKILETSKMLVRIQTQHKCTKWYRIGNRGAWNLNSAFQKALETPASLILTNKTCQFFKKHAKDIKNEMFYWNYVISIVFLNNRSLLPP